MRPADRAWLVIGAGVLAYEIAARDGELLSEAADRYLLAHPWLTRAVVVSVAVHLCNAIPQRFDVLHWLFVAKNRARNPIGVSAQKDRETMSHLIWTVLSNLPLPALIPAVFAVSPR